MLADEKEGTKQRPFLALSRYEYLGLHYGTDEKLYDFYRLTAKPMQDYLKPAKSGEFNTLQVLMDQAVRRVFVNGRFYCEIPAPAAADPATPWLIGLSVPSKSALELDSIRVIDGDTTPASPYFVQKTVPLDASGEAKVNARTLFQTPNIESLAIQLLDGEDLVDEAVVK